MKRGKKYLASAQLVEKGKKYPSLEAMQLAITTSTVKFDATIDAAFRFNLDPRKAEQNLRGAIVLPHGTGKVRRVLVIAKGEKAKEAEAAGADFFGDSDMIAKIQGGWFDFDIIVATPDMMGELGKLGRVLGPKGLMPNPKTGTVTMDVKKAVTEIKNGKVEFRVDRTGNILVPIGKVSFGSQKLAENIKTVYEHLIKLRPSTVKGTFVKNVTVSASMGPGIKVDSETISAV